ncbi:UPF0755 protein [Clostridium sp. USBA 49]|jgi:UPF0755 protein|uniref:endolytic transglycosylase MltG n=1 Tax=Clostridium TaxID=1485 RepID=UPI00099AA0D0|nr:MULTISPECIES: endolytic transglycosylase MltG [Clostridium]SKA75977.1 UPF0755 protein [Clostridium sp. USBA 49]
MKKFIIPFVIIFAFIVFKIYLNIVGTIKQPFINNNGNIEVKVSNGDNLNKLIASLYNENKIKNLYLTKWYIKKQKFNTNIKPGIYSISNKISLDEFVKILNEGKYNKNLVKVTIPEGYTIDNIASLLEEKKVISKDKFIKSIKEYKLPTYIKKDKNRKYQLEGYLFPDTYEFAKDMSGKEIINIMINNFEKVLKEIEEENNKLINEEEIDKIIIMASIIEKEAEVSSERPIVASVFYNRIKEKMPLQSCATVEYVLGIHKTVYTYNDLKIESPYNTYKVKALPVGPISNPGKSAIEAALNPAKTNYLYFVSKFDGTKTHFFTRDYNEFLKYKKESDENLLKMNK